MNMEQGGDEPLPDLVTLREMELGVWYALEIGDIAHYIAQVSYMRVNESHVIWVWPEHNKTGYNVNPNTYIGARFRRRPNGFWITIKN